LWNATKFALLYFVGDEKYSAITNLSGRENNMDIWILSRLANTIQNCNKSFENYDFAAATTACYNFWLYDLCDVYLECLKPIFQSENETAKLESRKTLFTCLDYGLKLISPFMPFITEELYQRLPRNDSTPSICVAPYPEIDVCPWYNEQVEKDVEFVQKTASRIRSARSDYNIPNKTKTEGFIVCTDDQPNDILKKYQNDLATTSFCSKFIFDSKPPVGCAIITISGQCEVHLLLKGLIEVDKELGKLEKKKNHSWNKLLIN